MNAMRFGTLVLAWLWAHHDALVASAAVLVALLRAVPAGTWERLERDWPRATNLARVLRAIAPDIVKAARALWLLWGGRPWPDAVAVRLASRLPVDPPPTTTNTRGSA
jgi:hypothetical protein